MSPNGLGEAVTHASTQFWPVNLVNWYSLPCQNRYTWQENTALILAVKDICASSIRICALSSCCEAFVTYRPGKMLWHSSTFQNLLHQAAMYCLKLVGRCSCGLNNCSHGLPKQLHRRAQSLATFVSIQRRSRRCYACSIR